jgi:hypothetical protein
LLNPSSTEEPLELTSPSFGESALRSLLDRPLNAFSEGKTADLHQSKISAILQSKDTEHPQLWIKDSALWNNMFVEGNLSTGSEGVV